MALTVVTLLSVVAGALAGEFIPIGWLSRLAGLAFIAIGGFMLWSSRRGSSEKGEEEETSRIPPRTRRPLGLLAGSFGLLLVAEMGAKSQLSVVSITAKTGSPLSVFLGASLALAVVTLLGVLAGTAVTRIIPVRWVSRGAVLLFIVIGLLTLVGISEQGTLKIPTIVIPRRCSNRAWTSADRGAVLGSAMSLAISASVGHSFIAWVPQPLSVGRAKSPEIHKETGLRHVRDACLLGHYQYNSAP